MTLDSEASTPQKTIKLSGYYKKRKKSYSLLENTIKEEKISYGRHSGTFTSSRQESLRQPSYDLVVKNLNKIYGDNQVLKNISESFKSGRISCILGHNGAGKSTLIKILSGLLTRSSGEIKYCGIKNFWQDRRMRMKVGIVTTENLLESEFTVFQQLKVICLLKDVKGVRDRRIKREKQLMEGSEDNDPSIENNLHKKLMDDSIYKKIKNNASSNNFDDSTQTLFDSEFDAELNSPEFKSGKMEYVQWKIEKILEKFNLSGFKDEKIKNLSEGVKRKLLIAIAFVNNPKLIFLDEPTSTIDSINRKEIWHFIKDYKSDFFSF